MEVSTGDLTGIEKASVLMMSLGAETSAKVFDYLTAEEREVLGATVTRVRHIDDVTRRRVIDEVNRAIGAARFDERRLSDEPLRWLESLPSLSVERMLSSERPTTVAMVLSRLAPASAAGVLQCMQDAPRNEVARCLATMGSPSSDIVEAVDKALRSKAEARRSDEPSDIARVSRGASRTVAVDVESLASLADHTARAILADATREDLALVMRVAGDELTSCILRNVSSEDAAALSREMESPAQVKLREIEGAQERLCRLIERGARPEARVE